MPLGAPAVTCLSGTSVGDAGFASLKGLGQLNTLVLEKTKVTGAGLLYVRQTIAIVQATRQIP